MEFWVSLVKTPDRNEFLEKNCTHVTGDFFLFEGDDEILEDGLSSHTIEGHGAVESLFGLKEAELKDVVLDCLGVEL